jgi:hypothetical protein
VSDPTISPTAAFAAARIWSSGSGFSGCGTMASRRQETFEVQDGSGQHFEDSREQGHRRHLVPLQFYGVVQDPPRARPACPDPDQHRVAGAGQPLQLMRGQGLSGGDLDLDNLGNAVIGVEALRSSSVSTSMQCQLLLTMPIVRGAASRLRPSA